MAITNQERIGKTLALLKAGLRVYVERGILGQSRIDARCPGGRDQDARVNKGERH